MADVDHGYTYNIDVKSKFGALIGVPEVGPVIPPPVTKREEPKIKRDTPKERHDAVVAPTVSVSKSRGGGSMTAEERPQENFVDRTSEHPRGQGNARGSRRPYGDRGRGRGSSSQNFGGDSDGIDRREDHPRNENRGRRGGRGRPYGDHRDFDRHSGSDRTGVKAIMKKDGYGAGNWGTVEDDLEAQMEPVPEEEVKTSDTSVEIIEADESKPAEVVEMPAKMTLDEFKAMQKASKFNVKLASNASAREPNDGKDVFKNMKAHQKIVQESDDNDEVEFVPVVEKEVKSFIVFDFGRTRRGGPSGERRGGRGGFRGSGGTGGPGRNFRDDSGFEATEETQPFRGPAGGYRRGRGRGAGSEDDAGDGDRRSFRGRGRGRGGFSNEIQQDDTNSADPPHRGFRGGGRGGFRGGGGGDDGFVRGRGSGRGGPRGGPRQFDGDGSAYTEDATNSGDHPQRGYRGGSGRGGFGGDGFVRGRGSGRGGPRQFDGDSSAYTEDATSSGDHSQRGYRGGGGRGGFGGDGYVRGRGSGRGGPRQFDGDNSAYTDVTGDVDSSGSTNVRGGRGRFNAPRGGSSHRGGNYTPVGVHRPPQIDNEEDFPELK